VARARDSSLLQDVWAGFGLHPAFLFNDYQGLFPWGLSIWGMNHYLVPRLRLGVAILPLPLSTFVVRIGTALFFWAHTLDSKCVGVELGLYCIMFPKNLEAFTMCSKCYCSLHLMNCLHILWQLPQYNTTYTFIIVFIPALHADSIHHPSMHGTTAPLGPGLPQRGTSILLYPQLVSSIHVLLGPTMHPSGRCPPILFLIFLLLLCCGISH
jgi:hypothetical protein